MGIKIHSIAVSILLLALQANAQQGVVFDWVRVIGGPLGDHGITVTTDPWGNVYSAGFFNGEVDFDPGVGEVKYSAVGNNDVYFTKYDKDGNFIWARAFGAGGTDQCFGIKADSQGYVYIAGQFGQTVDLNPGGDNGQLTSNGGNDVFVAKFDSSGSFIWGKNMGGTGTDIAYGLDIDKFGNVYTTGEFSGTEERPADFDPGPDSFALISRGSSDIFVCKLNPDGDLVWAKQMGSRSADYSYAIAVDDLGNVYTTGNFQDSADFDPGSGTQYIVSEGGYDIFISKLDSSGNYVWAHGIGSPGSDFGYGIAVSDSGHVYTTGYFQQSADFDPGAGNTILQTVGGADMFVTKFESDGTLIWAKRMGGSLTEYGRAIDVDLKGNVYVGGWFNSLDASFDPDSTGGSISRIGGNDLVIVKLNFDGMYQWSVNMGGIASDFGYGIAVDNSGNVHTTGYVQNRIDFDPGPDSFMVDAQVGGYDFYVHKLLCVDTSSFTLDVDTCAESFTFNGILYQESGNYIQKFPNLAGCDSIYNLNLTLRGILEKPVISVDTFTLSTILPYASYQWIKNGTAIPGATNRTYIVDENADYSVAVSNEFGCLDTSEVYRVTNYGTNIDELSQLRMRIKVYPNPSDDLIKIESPVDVYLEILNIEGKVVMSNIKSNQLSLKNLADGLYLLKIRDNKGNVLKNEKIIKNSL